MSVGRFFEANLARILAARARRAAAVQVPARTVEAAVSRCLVTLRPRHRWPENTRPYAFLRARLADNPVGSLAAFSAAAAGALYLGFGRAAVAWLGALLGGPG
jgi:hypothetical protein